MEEDRSSQCRSVLPRMNVVFVGHVDHGKSTTIGRLCHDTGALSQDRLAEIERVSRQLGRPTEFAFATDHLEEERTGGLTIDTSQVFFKSSRRHYVIIDAPGHKEFLRNMITGASQAEAALLVIDAAEGMGEQSRRHAFLLSMLSIRSVIVLINKMDRVGFAAERFCALQKEAESLLQRLGLSPASFVPISAALGDNVATHSRAMPWYAGPTVLEALDSLQRQPEPLDQPLRLPVQDVYSLGGRELIVGQLLTGSVGQGDPVQVLPGSRAACVASLEEFGRRPTRAEAGQSIGLTLDRAERAGVRRGDVICDSSSPPLQANRFSGCLFWMSSTPLSLSDRLTVRLATQQSPCRMRAIRERTDSSTLELIEHNASALAHTEVAEVDLECGGCIVFELYCRLPPLGRFVLERDSEVVAAGTISAAG